MPCLRNKSILTVLLMVASLSAAPAVERQPAEAICKSCALLIETCPVDPDFVSSFAIVKNKETLYSFGEIACAGGATKATGSGEDKINDFHFLAKKQIVMGKNALVFETDFAGMCCPNCCRRLYVIQFKGDQPQAVSVDLSSEIYFNGFSQSGNGVLFQFSGMQWNEPDFEFEIPYEKMTVEKFENALSEEYMFRLRNVPKPTP